MTLLFLTLAGKLLYYWLYFNTCWIDIVFLRIVFLTMFSTLAGLSVQYPRIYIFTLCPPRPPRHHCWTLCPPLPRWPQVTCGPQPTNQRRAGRGLSQWERCYAGTCDSRAPGNKEMTATTSSPSVRSQHMPHATYIHTTRAECEIALKLRLKCVFSFSKLV